MTATTTPRSDAQEERSPAAARHPWAALAVLMLPVLLVAVDNTVLAFAVPSISESLRPTGNQLLWIVDAYPLVLAGLLVPMGSLGDRIGRRRILMIGATGFALVSAAAAFAPTASMLIAARAAMGLFGAALMPATLSLIRNIFLDPSRRRTAIAIWAAGFSGGAALGPIVGGLLLEHFWWGSVFLLALPFLVPLLALAPVLVPESRDPQPGPLDPVSALLCLLAMLPLVYGIKTVAAAPLTGTLLLLAALLVGALFVRRQLRRPDPMLDVRLFTNPVFSGSVAANLLSIFSLVGFILFVSQHLQLVSGLSPVRAGLVLVPGLAVTVVAGLAVVPLARRVRPSHLVAGGLLLNAVGYALVLASGRTGSDVGLLVAFTVLGAGIGAAETISNDLIVSSVPASRAGAASAVSETAYELGAVLGTAVLGTILTVAYRAHVEVPAGLSPEDARAAAETIGGATEAARSLPPATAEALLTSARHAFDSGVTWTSAIGVVLMLAAAVLVLRALRTAA